MSYLSSNTIDCIDMAKIALEKSALILGDLTTDYSFAEKPSIDFNMANHEATQLVWEYNRIITFMHMAHDYVFEAQRLLERAGEEA